MPWREAILAGCGVACLLIGMWWRARSRQHADAVLEAALTSADPSDRIAAIRVAAGQGLGRHAAAFLRLAKEEQDAHVRQVLVEVVVNNQWEPMVSADLVELRLLAQSEFEPRRRNGRGRGSSMQQLRNGLRLVSSDESEDDSTPDAVPSASAAESAATDEAEPATDEAEPDAAAQRAVGD